MLLCALHDYSKARESIFSTNLSLQGPRNDPCPCLARQPCVIFLRPGRGASSGRRAPPALGASEDGPWPQRQPAWPGFPDGCQGSPGWSAFSRRFLLYICRCFVSGGFGCKMAASAPCGLGYMIDSRVALMGLGLLFQFNPGPGDPTCLTVQLCEASFRQLLFFGTRKRFLPTILDSAYCEAP